MKRIYIAGPYSANNVMDVLNNIRRGIELSYEVLKAGYAPFCPWLDFHYVLMDRNNKLTIDDFYQYSIAWLLVSDAMLLIEGWETSEGTLKEIDIAEFRDIPIFETLDELMSYQWHTS